MVLAYLSTNITFHGKVLFGVSDMGLCKGVLIVDVPIMITILALFLFNLDNLFILL